MQLNHRIPLSIMLSSWSNGSIIALLLVPVGHHFNLTILNTITIIIIYCVLSGIVMSISHKLSAKEWREEGDVEKIRAEIEFENKILADLDLTEEDLEGLQKENELTLAQLSSEAKSANHIGHPNSIFVFAGYQLCAISCIAILYLSQIQYTLTYILSFTLLAMLQLFNAKIRGKNPLHYIILTWVYFALLSMLLTILIKVIL